MKEKILEVLDKKDVQIHFIGIGGKGLNGIARFCLKKGFKVSGSDLNKGDETESIKHLGGKVFYTHQSSNIVKGIDLVVKTSILRDDNPEIIKTKEEGILIVKRSEFLGAIISKYKNISVAGSHGKSTTTALIGLALQFAKEDPTIFGGAYIKELGSYEKVGGGELSVTEACEYDRSFYDLIGEISIITSLEKSHMEYYKDEGEMVDAFKEYIEMHKSSSTIILNGDNVHLRKIISNSRAKCLTYGFNFVNDYVIRDVRYESDKSIFSVYMGNTPVIKDLEIKIPGAYNVLNYVSVVALFHQFGFGLENIREVGDVFTGVGRRFEIHPVNEILTFVDDFSHHPTQVKNLFDSLKQFFPDHRICAVFQPRQYHLIKTFIKEYGSAFKNADEVLVTDIVPALGDRKSDTESLNVDDVITSIKNNSYIKNVKYMKSFNGIVRSIKKGTKDKTIVATIGAGDINKIRDLYVKTV